MGKPEWGAKRACPNCGGRFYDLQRDPVTCPYCGSAYQLDSLSERKPTQAVRAKERPEPEKAAEPEAAVAEEESDLIDDEDTVSEDVLLAEEGEDDDLSDIDVAKDSDEEES